MFVDCGAFTGDTVEAFIEARHGEYKAAVGDRAGCREPPAMQARFDRWSGRATVQCASSRSPQARARDLELRDHRHGWLTVGAGTEIVEVAPLDEMLADDGPTYIKFDVEGAEHDALVGGSETIRAQMPVLAVCLYHRPHDLWDLPLLVRSSPRLPDVRPPVQRRALGAGPVRRPAGPRAQLAEGLDPVDATGMRAGLQERRPLAAEVAVDRCRTGGQEPWRVSRSAHACTAKFGRSIGTPLVRAAHRTKVTPARARISFARPPNQRVLIACRARPRSSPRGSLLDAERDRHGHAAVGSPRELRPSLG